MSARYNVWIVTGLLARLRLPEGPRRTAALAAWLQSLYPEGRAPALVGSAAIELLTRTDLRVEDFDFIGDVPPQVAERLRRVGFREIGRRWILDSDGIVLDFPGVRLSPGTPCVTLRIDDIQVRVARPQLIVERAVD